MKYYNGCIYFGSENYFFEFFLYIWQLRRINVNVARLQLFSVLNCMGKIISLITLANFVMML